jgi:subtilisin
MFSRYFPIAALVALCCSVFGPSLTAAAAPFDMSQLEQQNERLFQHLDEKAQQVKNKYIVVYKKGSAQGDVEKKYGVTRALVFQKVLSGFAADLTPEQLQKLKGDADVDFIEPDFVVQAFTQPKAEAIDWNQFFNRFKTSSSSSKSSSVSSAKPSSSSLSSAPASSSKPSSVSSASSVTSTVTVSVPTGINRIDAEKSPTAAINNVVNNLDVDVAIIDTGIDLTHPDLNVYRNVNFVNTSANGNDDNGHGTHVSGTIGAKDDGQGVVGVAPGARLWAVKVLGSDGSGLMSNIIAGIDYVTQHASEIEVANMSLGCECTSTALNNAINNAVAAGVVITVAAGNSGKDSATFSPANNPNVITVSAVADFNGLPGGGAAATCRSDVDDTFADFSNYGAPVDIAAPGVCINSTYKGGAYALMSGTSMASPHVAGAAALYIAGHGRATNASGVNAIKNALISAAQAQNGPNGFTGDPDGSKEPLLNVQSF